MRRLRASPAVTVALLLGALLGAACDRPTIGRTGGTLTLAVRADVTGFYPNPPVVSEAFTIDANRSIYDTLMGFDSHLRVRPSLAERWENPDDQTYLFDLREGLRFSDGRPLTARDVAASLDAALQRHWVTSDFLAVVESARPVGERRVEVRTRFPYFALLARLAWGFVLPADALDRQPVPLVGSGPYRLERWVPRSEIALVRNPHYWGPAPAFDRVRFLVMPDDRERVEAVVSGRADVADNVPLSELDRLEGSPAVRSAAGPGLRVLFLAMRLDTPPFSDRRVREALDLAIDRDELIRRVYGGKAQVATQIVPAATFGHNPLIPPPRYDPAAARRLLAQAGLTRGTRLKLEGPIDRYLNDRQTLAEVARQLRQVGLEVEVEGIEKRRFFPLIESGRSPFHLLGWACDSGDAGDVLDNYLHSPRGTMGTLNSLALADATLDTLIDNANQSRRESERRRLLQATLQRVAELRPILPLVVQTESILISRRIAWEPPINFALRPAEMRPAGAGN